MVPPERKIKSYPLIPEEERKCVWMTSGFISYKLCDRGFECEACPLDEAIRSGAIGEDDLKESGKNGADGWMESDSSTRMNGSIFYHPDHCWAQVEDSGNVKVGIDDLLAQLMMEVKVVILPRTGSFSGQGECCAHIINGDYIFPVTSPLSGSIQTANPRLKEKPELVINDPRGEGWLVTIKPGNLESDLKNLLFGRRARLWYQREEKEILARIDSLMNRTPGELGPTMQDGGVRIDGLQNRLDAITPRQRTQLLDSSIRRTKQRCSSGPL